MDFLKVAEAFEKVEGKSSRLQMTDLMAELLKEASSKDIEKLVYVSQGRLAPDYISIDVGMGEKFVMDAIAKVSGHSRQEIEKMFREKGDLGIVAEEMIKKKKQRSLHQERLSLEKVCNNLMKIAQSSGSGSQESKINLLAELLNSSHPVEAKFIVRIPLGSMRLGIGDPTIMDSLALIYLPEFRKKNPALLKELSEKYKKTEDIDRQARMRLSEEIEAKYNIHPDLGKISSLLKEKGIDGLKQLKIEVGIPIRPTLAERLPSSEEIIEKLGKCLVEAKYDGFRMAVHKDGNNVRLFSRKQEETTKMFPEIVDAVKKQISADKAIFEGEALAFNEGTEEFFPFQVTIQRKRKYDVKEFSKKFPLRLFCFDLLFLNGKNVMELPFRERREHLGKIIKKGDAIELTKAIVTDKPAEMTEFFDECVSKGLEGIIAKDLNEKYIAGARKFAWIKLKRSYKGELSDTVDAAIIGYFTGKGQRTEFGLGILLAAVFNDKKNRFESIAKVGSGLSEQQMQDFEKMLVKTKRPKRPSNVVSELEPHFWVEPKYVIEVNADEITKSPIHSAGKDELGEGLALRFPRLVKLRTDKKPEDATTVKEIIKMFKSQKHVKMAEQ